MLKLRSIPILWFLAACKRANGHELRQQARKRASAKKVRSSERPKRPAALSVWLRSRRRSPESALISKFMASRIVHGQTDLLRIAADGKQQARVDRHHSTAQSCDSWPVGNCQFKAGGDAIAVARWQLEDKKSYPCFSHPRNTQ